MKLYFVAGEASGDNHGAALLEALRAADPALEFAGRGGPRLRALAGDGIHDWIGEAAVVGLWEVLKKYGWFRAQFQEVLREIDRAAPDAVVLIDYPGFNLRLARTLRARHPALRIIYYISPQVWAWHRGRIGRMAGYLDLMLCIFPFEAALYQQSGLRAIFVGHPMTETAVPPPAPETRDRDLVALFPGSRKREVSKILPVLLEAAAHLLAARPATRFEIAAASAGMAEMAQELLAGTKLAPDRVTIRTGEGRELMRRAHIGLIASGTATLEAALHRLPFLLVYKVSPLTYLAARLLVQVPHLGMPNVIAGREIVPEFIQGKADPRLLAESALTLIYSEHARAAMRQDFDAVVAQLGEEGASRKAAAAIMEELRRPAA